MVLAQLTVTELSSICGVIVGGFAVLTTVMVFYLRAAREDMKQAVGEVSAKVGEVSGKLAKLDTRLAVVEERKVGRREHVLNAARTNGKIDKVFECLAEVKSLVHEVRGRLEGELGSGKQISAAADRIVGALNKDTVA